MTKANHNTTIPHYTGKETTHKTGGNFGMLRPVAWAQRGERPASNECKPGIGGRGYKLRGYLLLCNEISMHYDRCVSPTIRHRRLTSNTIMSLK